VKSTEHYTRSQWKQNQCDITEIIECMNNLSVKALHLLQFLSHKALQYFNKF